MVTEFFHLTENEGERFSKRVPKCFFSFFSATLATITRCAVLLSFILRLSNVVGSFIYNECELRFLLLLPVTASISYAKYGDVYYQHYRIYACGFIVSYSVIKKLSHFYTLISNTMVTVKPAPSPLMSCLNKLTRLQLSTPNQVSERLRQKHENTNL